MAVTRKQERDGVVEVAKGPGRAELTKVQGELATLKGKIVELCGESKLSLVLADHLEECDFQVRQAIKTVAERALGEG